MRIGKKTIHDVTIGLTMALPILYLCGSMIAGLAGAHGEQIWAEPVYVEDYVEVPDVVPGYDYRVKVDDYDTYYSWLDTRFISVEGNASIFCTFNNGSFYERVYYYRADNVLHTFALFPSFSSSTNSLLLYQNGNFFNQPWVFYFSAEHLSYISDFYDSESCTLSRLVEVPSENVPENNSAYTDFIFKNFFPKDNFVERIGENALSDNPKGFAPFGTMLSYLDENMFHAGDTQTALMVYGMIYWSLHVILADLVYHVLVFVPNLINRVFDWFGQKGVSDD